MNVSPSRRRVVERQPLGLALDERGFGHSGRRRRRASVPRQASRCSGRARRRGAGGARARLQPLLSRGIRPAPVSSGPTFIQETRKRRQRGSLSEGEEARVPMPTSGPSGAKRSRACSFMGLFSPRDSCEGSRADCCRGGRARVRREELAGVLAAEPAQGGRVYCAPTARGTGCRGSRSTRRASR